jgi:hypothetical protein
VYQVSACITVRQSAAVPPAFAAYVEASALLVESSMSAALRISAASPTDSVHASWIISCAPMPITTSSPAIAITEAAEAASRRPTR